VRMFSPSCVRAGCFVIAALAADACSCDELSPPAGRDREAGGGESSVDGESGDATLARDGSLDAEELSDARADGGSNASDADGGGGGCLSLGFDCTTSRECCSGVCTTAPGGGALVCGTLTESCTGPAQSCSSASLRREI
jgi:hypothetical protein